MSTTTFRFKAQLTNGMPSEDHNLLVSVVGNYSWRVDESGIIERPKIAHRFFDCERWLLLLTSTDFDERKFSHLSINADDSMVLDIYLELKNYDDEITLFLDWIRPYLLYTQEKEALGWFQYAFDDFKTIIQFIPDRKDFELVKEVKE